MILKLESNLTPSFYGGVRTLAWVSIIGAFIESRCLMGEGYLVFDKIRNGAVQKEEKDYLVLYKVLEWGHPKGKMVTFGWKMVT